MGKIEMTKEVLGIWATNCYTVVDTETKEALIIDPADRADVLLSLIHICCDADKARGKRSQRGLHTESNIRRTALPDLV